MRSEQFDHQIAEVVGKSVHIAWISSLAKIREKRTEGENRGEQPDRLPPPACPRSIRPTRPAGVPLQGRGRARLAPQVSHEIERLERLDNLPVGFPLPEQRRRSAVNPLTRLTNSMTDQQLRKQIVSERHG
jgi:hypothetical protein